MYSAKAYGQYQRMQINTASPGQLVLMLYDAAIRWAEDAVEALQTRELEKGHRLLLKAQEAIAELSAGLNMEAGGAIAQSLAQLYEYAGRQLMEANVKKDPASAQEAIALLSSLRETWEDVITKRECRSLESMGELNVGG